MEAQWFTRGTARFTVFKTTDLQLRYNYRAPRQTTQGEAKSLYTFDIAANRDILKGKGTLTLSVRDVLNSRKRRYTSEGINFYTTGEFQWRSRITTLTFTYRLNQDKKRSRGRQRGGYDGGGDEGF